jgi:GTPase
MDPDAEVLLPEDLPPDHRSGFVSVVGRPNVGKSTLINRLLGQKIAIVSPRAQTTRNRLLGILTRDDSQIIFLDTPGIHTPQHRLGEIMVEVAAETLEDADVILWVVDVSTSPRDEDRRVAELLAGNLSKVILALNKADTLRPEHVQENVDAYAALAPAAKWELVSATRGDNLDGLLGMIIAALPLGPRFYPEGQVTDQQERFMVAELVREQVLTHLREEVPHAIAVEVTEFKTREPEVVRPGASAKNPVIYIAATIYVERESQRVIVLGKDGQMLKAIGQSARHGIEALLETRVYLELWVKVRPKWRSDEAELRRLGYRSPRRE